MKAIDVIKRYEPCDDAVEWLGDRTIDEMIDECPRGDWMMWLAFKVGIDKRLLTLAKARCAKTVIHLMKDQRSINAVEVAERYGLGEATDNELDAAYVHAAAAVNAIETDDAEYYSAAAAFAAVYRNAVRAYASVTYNSDADAAAGSAAAASANKKIENQLMTANICRKLLGAEIKLILL